MHLIGWVIVNLTLLLGNGFKYLDTPVFHLLAESARPDDFSDIFQSSMFLSFRFHPDQEQGAKKTSTLFPLHLEFVPVEGKATKGLAQHLEVQPSIQQGAQKHVATDTGKTIQVGYLHSTIHFTRDLITHKHICKMTNNLLKMR